MAEEKDGMSEDKDRMSEDKDKERVERLVSVPLVGKVRLRTVVVSTLGTILLGIVSSGIWDLAVKPGLFAASDIVLWLAGTLSTTIRNAPYSTAALGSAAMPSVLLLFMAIIGLVSPSFYAFGFTLGRRAAAKSSGSDLTQKHRRSVAWGGFLIFALVMVALPGMIGGSVINHAVLIERLFNANVTILAQAAEETEIRRLRAKFASMTSREDYLALQAELVDLAKRLGVTLRPEHTSGFWIGM